MYNIRVEYIIIIHVHYTKHQRSRKGPPAGTTDVYNNNNNNNVLHHYTYYIKLCI